MFDEKGAMIGETSGELSAETPDPVHLPRQESAALAGQCPPLKSASTRRLPSP
jgi:hypothetical protein